MAAKKLHLFDTEEFEDVFQEYFGVEEENSKEEDYPESDTSEEDSEFNQSSETVAENAIEILENNANVETEQNLNSFVRESEEDGSFTGNHLEICKCSCSQGPGSSRCITQFENQQITDARLAVVELSSEGKEIAILSAIQCGNHNSKQTVNSKRSSQTDRKKSRTTYHFLNKPICTTTFTYLYAISPDTLRVLVKHFNDVKCILPRKLKRGNHNKITFEQSTRFHSFMKNYLEQHSLILPGRMSGISKHATEVLPSHTTKGKMYETYIAALRQDEEQKISLSSFLRLWKLLFPTVYICHPMSDLCWTCQKNNTTIYQ